MQDRCRGRPADVPGVVAQLEHCVAGVIAPGELETDCSLLHYWLLRETMSAGAQDVDQSGTGINHEMITPVARV